MGILGRRKPCLLSESWGKSGEILSIHIFPFFELGMSMRYGGSEEVLRPEGEPGDFFLYFHTFFVLGNSMKYSGSGDWVKESSSPCERKLFPLKMTMGYSSSE